MPKDLEFLLGPLPQHPLFCHPSNLGYNLSLFSEQSRAYVKQKGKGPAADSVEMSRSVAAQGG